jgi:HAD-superfamily hydrolase, subfamily IIB
MSKIFFSDLDGTLLHNRRGVLLPSIDDEKAIKTFVKSDNTFIVATGRAHHHILKLMQNIDVPCVYGIAMNGAVIIKDAEIIKCTPLPTKDIKLVWEVIKKSSAQIDLAALVLISGTLFVKERTLHGWLIKNIYYRLRRRKQLMWKFDTLEKLDATNRTVGKILIHSKKKSEIEKLYQELIAKFGSQFSIFIVGSNEIEICEKTVNKFQAVTYIAELEQKSLKEIAFVGDSGNDLLALQKLENSYIMANADEKFKEPQMKIVTTVAEAINDFAGKND